MQCLITIKLRGKEVVVECKFNGDLIQIHKNGKDIHFCSRNFLTILNMRIPCWMLSCKIFLLTEVQINLCSQNK
ncbi:hypothetical protein CsSME_00037153 [Camellia sinensis var. sinensis]